MHWKHSGSRLVRIFYRDGVIYLVSLVVISAINIVFSVIDDLNFYYDVMLEPQRIAHAVLVNGSNLPGDTDLEHPPVSLELKSMAFTLASSTDMEV